MCLEAAEKNKIMKIKVYYVYHSCFIVEYNSCYMMFDYYKHYNFKEEYDFDFDSLIKTILESNKPFYIFSSHGHGDHFNKKIFEYDSHNTIYILSDDIVIEKPLSNIHFISPGKMIKLGDIVINAFSSTDLGVSFVIDVENTVIFHAGDLNWWAWSDDTKEEAEYMENLFKNTVEQIRELNKPIDIAFFPVDKRLEENYAMGGSYFIEQINPRIFIPMHFSDDVVTTDLFYQENHNKHSETKILKINNVNKKII